MKNPRIAILIAHWPVHSSVGYMAGWLERQGWATDVFLHDCDETLSADLIKESSLIKIHRSNEKSNSGVAVEHKNPATMGLGLLKTALPQPVRQGIRNLQEQLLLWMRSRHSFVSSKEVNKVLHISRQTPYSVLLGVEKGGLLWAGMVAAQLDVPVAYYSLELYTRDHPTIAKSKRLRRLKALEERHHQGCALTIVQDEPRGRVLLSDNRIRKSMKLAYLPVCLSGHPDLSHSRWLHEELGLSQKKILVLSYGIISRERRSIELAKVAQSFPENWQLVFHGYGSEKDIEKIRMADLEKRVSLSQRLVPADQRELVVRSAQIGLAIYNDEPINDRLTGRSSEKIAIYLRCGLPIIAFRHESYEHIATDEAGILIRTLDEIPSAIQTILDNYSEFVKRACACYRKHYCFEENFPPVFEHFQQLVGVSNKNAAFLDRSERLQKSSSCSCS